MRAISKTTRTYLLGHLAASKCVQDRLINELALVTLEIHEIQSLINRSLAYRNDTGRPKTDDSKAKQIPTSKFRSQHEIL
jgi:hypothetical protein